MELKYGADTISGTVVSGRVVKADDKQPEREQLVALLDSGELRTLDLAASSSIRFADAKLQAQLRDYLTVVNQSRSTDKRSIYIDSSDAKERQIDASYMIPAPVWKSSYRLIFNEKGDPTLEGWAIIDNTSGEDWTQCSAGRGVGTSGIFHQQSVRAEICAAANGGTAGGSSGESSGLWTEL